jgi:hypothetical protein
MTKRLKYTGTSPIWGTTITGKPDRWYPGTSQEVSDGDAALYIASGLGFAVDQGDTLSASAVAAVGALVSGALMPGAFASPAGAQKVFGGAGTAVGSGTTVVTQHWAEASFSAVQLIYGNWGASTWNVDIAKVAASPTHLNDGTGLTPVAVTFTDSGTTVVPVSPYGSGNNIVPGLLVSDVIPIASVARTDTPANKRLLLHRVYAAGAQSAVSGADQVAWNALWTTRQSGSRVPSGDQVTGWQAWAPVENAGSGWIQPAAVRFLYDVPSVTIAVCGDSLDRGQATTASSSAWLVRTCYAMSTPARIVSPLNMAWSGQTHTASAKMAKQAINNLKPNILVIPAWSPNDSAASQAIMDLAWSETLEIIEYGRQRGVQVWVRTSGPVNSYSTADDARIKAQNTRVRGLSGRILVLDHASIIENPINPSQIRSEYNSGDGLHYNDACHSALASYDQAMFSLALGSF